MTSVTGTPTLGPSEPTLPMDARADQWPTRGPAGPRHARSRPSRRDPAEEPAPLVAAVARAVALIVVLPVRLLWEFVAATGRLIDRYLLTPAGRFLHRWLLLPLAWVARTLLW